jgi:hypothetical protein
MTLIKKKLKVRTVILTEKQNLNFNHLSNPKPKLTLNPKSKP